MSDAPLSDVQRDALIRTMTRQARDSEARLAAALTTIKELRAELVTTHEELAALKAGIYPEAPFRA